MKAFFASLKRFFIVLTAMQGISWLYGFDETFHIFVGQNRISVTLVSAFFILINWIMYDSWNANQKKTMLTPPASTHSTTHHSHKSGKGKHP
ncbi:hypothetical protein HNR55_002508 [Acetobacter lovaniensis]|uniref:Uncharacterized protein n=1 Tax=Acetobacter lovaniensis TaxID=104100 RepID=A0A841QI47_9PROT|nr:hypothetical protein [Acetobacter lovaniensis]NHN82165.1 hypothetical protein [Acetobacter lovaniensis]